MVERINLDTLKNLVDGNVKEDVTCVIKFYSSRCGYCDNLKPVYETLSEQYGDKVYFFAINVDDPVDETPPVTVNGVPTICMIKIDNEVKVTMLDEPDEPHPVTWYWLEYMKDFVDRGLYR
jgi:thiol-disulfide isomerase/thioredoxin|tara:strand:+ start:242 stop:604 length:363 start_codon:yes stop_codon:yes gene_type:complete